jgi:hypothetical protein
MSDHRPSHSPRPKRKGQIPHASQAGRKKRAIHDQDIRRSTTRRASQSDNRVESTRMRAERVRHAKRQRQTRARLVGVLLLVIVFIIALVFAAKFVMGQLADRDTATAQDPASEYTPVPCAPASVKTEISASGSTAGEDMTFTVTLTNTSDTNPCYIDVGWGNMNITVTSGSATVASLAACESGSESTLLLLDRDMTTKRTLTWSGGVGDGCVDPADNAAQAGTYVAELRFTDSSAPVAQTSFILN